jgi:hypothetical protein
MWDREEEAAEGKKKATKREQTSPSTGACDKQRASFYSLSLSLSLSHINIIPFNNSSND